MKTPNYLKRVLISIDQLGNALCDGDPDTTISARLHWLSEIQNRDEWGAKYFTILRRIVDYSFYPFDGEGHCYQAYYSQPHKTLRGSKVALSVLGFFIGISCVLIIPVGWIYNLIKVIKLTK